jgi:hypothetical protein
VLGCVAELLAIPRQTVVSSSALNSNIRHRAFVTNLLIGPTALANRKLAVRLAWNVSSIVELELSWPVL